MAEAELCGGIGGQTIAAQAGGKFRKPSRRCQFASAIARESGQAHAPRSITLLTLRLWAPAVGHHIDLPPAPPATTTMRSRGSLMIGTMALSSFLLTQTGKNGPLDLPRFLAMPQGLRAISKMAFFSSTFFHPPPALSSPFSFTHHN